MDETLDFLAAERCSAILRTHHPRAVLPALRAAIEGGFKVVECTLNTPGALGAIEECAANPDLLVGAGTVLSVEDARMATGAGARFLVSPVCDPDVIAWGVENDIVIIPGTYTPTEMLRAHRLGAPIVKLFPGPPNGPDFVRAVRGPMPFLRIFPTSGVTLENAREFLDAGAFGVGFVNCLFQPDDLAGERFDLLRERAARMVACTASDI
jgi:Entner-Doudoroff aldolase